MSIVVPTYNRWASLERLLRALGEQTFPQDRFEVLVVDDGSDDATLEHLKQLQLPYLLRVLEQAHQGPAAARNLGIVNATAPLVLFLDDDVVPAANLIEVHVATHAREGSNVVVIGPMSPPEGWPRPAWVRWEENKLERQYSAMRTGKWSCSWRQFYTGNSSVDRSLLLASGGFDTTFKRAEDVELGFRLGALGARFLFAPSADVLHFASRTFKSWRRTPYQYGQYDVIMSRRAGHAGLALVMQEFRWRHPLNRMLTRMVAGRTRLLKAVVALLSGIVLLAEACRAHTVARQALSGVFNLLYWQGVCDEIGGPVALWRAAADQSAA